MRLRYIDVVAISDLHGILPSIPPAHLLVIAGDIFPSKESRLFCKERLEPWLLRQPVAEIVAVAGNRGVEPRRVRMIDRCDRPFIEEGVCAP